MPDPLDELENFTPPGLTMDPMPAAEVRRRGTRLRRRNTALATVGGVAAVALIATPLAVIAGNQGKSEPMPAPPSQAWTQTIPDDFPLTDQMSGAPRVEDGAGFELIELCGRTAWSPTAPVTSVDVAGAFVPQTEGGEGRTLALYRDDADATRALDDLRTAVEDCPVEPNGRGFDQRLDVQPAPAGEDAVAFSQRSVDEASELVGELTVVQAVRVGNAVLLAASTTQGGSSDEMVASNLLRLTTGTAGVVGDMCLFSAAGCGEDDPGTAEESGEADVSATAIPDDFPLLDGLPTRAATEDFGRTGPSRSTAPIEVTACPGATVRTPDSEDLLRAGWTDPAEERQRQLMTFGSAESAQAYVDRVRAAFDCPTEDLPGDVERIRSVRDSDLGDSSVVAVMHHVVDGTPAPGFQVVHAVRVGQAVLLSTRVNDGDATPVTDEVVEDLLTDSTLSIGGVVEDMGSLG